jgi:peptidyl-prolyl cis-trans isomerase C
VMLREPLLHFALAGLVIFLIGRIYQEQTDPHRIMLTPQRTARLARQYALQYGVQPDAATLQKLVAGDVHDEILLREGLELGLDKDDEIVRRRIIQKMQFLLEDLRAPPEPDDARLQAYYRTHLDRYSLPARTTFSHIYFSDNPQRAAGVLQHLSRTSGRAPGSGDPFPDLYDFSNYDREQVERLFGHGEFTAAVFTTPPGRWVGPFRSTYGWHLLYVQSRQPAAARRFAQARDEVRADYLQQVQHQANDDAFHQLGRKFTIVELPH